eukprot:scaffold228393_cov17-Tisochrysis_lutea.AAC.1
MQLSTWGHAHKCGNAKATCKVTCCHRYLVEKLNTEFPNMAYLHMVEPRADGSGERHLQTRKVQPGYDLDHVRFSSKVVAWCKHLCDRQEKVEFALRWALLVKCVYLFKHLSVSNKNDNNSENALTNFVCRL